MRNRSRCIAITIADSREAPGETVCRAAGYLRRRASDLSGDLTPRLSSGDVVIKPGWALRFDRERGRAPAHAHALARRRHARATPPGGSRRGGCDRFQFTSLDPKR